MDENSISLEPVAIARHPVLFAQVTCLDTLCNVVNCNSAAVTQQCRVVQTRNAKECHNHDVVNQ